MSISAVVLTKNSERNLEKCLESIKWCNETIIVDDGSTDKTKEIAKKHKAKIFEHSLSEDFSLQRNFGLEKASGEWVLFIDSDETVSSSLREEINKFLSLDKNTRIVGYYIKRVDTMWGMRLRYGETGKLWFLRLARKNSGNWEGRVHEIWYVKGKTGKLKNTLDHFPHSTISEFLSKINFYSDLRAKELYNKGIQVKFLDVILYPKAKFYVNFLFKLGFLDGIPGFLVAAMMSFHSFLVRGKLWQLQNTQKN